MKISEFFNFQLTINETFKKFVSEKLPYGNAPRDKTVKDRRLKILGSIDKSLSELLKNGE
jgi:hypothetical protein